MNAISRYTMTKILALVTHSASDESEVLLTEGVSATLLRLLALHIILLGGILAWAAIAQSQPLDSTNGYHAIAKRNAFGLKNPVISAAPRLLVEPQEDLLLTGLSDVAGKPQAFFMLMEPGKQPSSFAIRQGEQNEWIELRGVSVKDGTARALLKKPLTRWRNVGEEIVLTFHSAGLKTRTVGNNRGNPHVENLNDP
jgi:hypothetical protein